MSRLVVAILASVAATVAAGSSSGGPVVRGVRGVRGVQVACGWSFTGVVDDAGDVRLFGRGGEGQPVKILQRTFVD